MTNIYTSLVQQVDSYVSKKIKDHRYILRVSDGEDLFKILTYGTDRAKISDKLWSPLTPVDFEITHKHEDVIIGSLYEDLIEDALLEKGTLKHKLEIIQYPLLVIYDLEKLDILYKEPKTDSQNQGIHFVFKSTNKLEALVNIFWVKKLSDDYTLHMYKLNMTELYK